MFANEIIFYNFRMRLFLLLAVLAAAATSMPHDVQVCVPLKTAIVSVL